MSTHEESKAQFTGRESRRRRLIVDKPFQYRLIGLLMAIWLANSLFFSIILYYFYEGHIQRFYELVPKPGIAPLLEAPVLFTIAIVFILVFGLVMLCIIGLYLSNQIAGPLYRVKMSLNRVSEGDVNFEVRFRNRDFLMDFPGYFNNMLRQLKERGVGDIENLKAIENSLAEPGKARALLREFRTKKEQQFGIPSEDPESASQGEPVSQSVH
jgi:methyl-accepting chemotaxis protein